MTIHLKAAALQQQITALLLDYPDLADDDVLRADMVEAETSLHEFLRRLERNRQDAVALATALDETVKSLRMRKHKFERREEAMRALALKLLFAAKQTKLEMPEATYGVRTNPPSVVITNEAALPDAACRFKREPDKVAIKDMLAIGPVEGACMSNGSKSLTIRIR